MRLINADAIVHYQTYDDEHEDFPEHESTIADFLDEMTDEGCPKPVDAVPVVHGRWFIGDDGALHCSKCSKIPVNRIIVNEIQIFDMTPIKEMMKYCPNCGAKID